MKKQKVQHSVVRRRDAFRQVAALESGKWQLLCESYLPIVSEDSIWRYSRHNGPRDLPQGWKLHISATILNANNVFEAVAPLLRRSGILFKAPRSLTELARLNSGLDYGYSQVGKFITVYPRSVDEATKLVPRLHRLVRGMPAPAVPFDLKFKPNSPIYYRYGSFKNLEIRNPDGSRIPAIRDRKGKLVPDLRISETATPDWIANPFPLTPLGKPSPERLSLQSLVVIGALSQRGKGGVYKALDISVSPPRFCILKEGRRDGETGWDGRDGFARVKHEKKVLTSLRKAGIGVPHIYSSFSIGNNYYLVMEFIEGETLLSFLLRRQRRLPVAQATWFGLRLTELLSRVHAAGWAWRDCKPTNLILTREKGLRPIDFEGAARTGFRDPVPWSTRAFIHPSQLRQNTIAPQKYDDSYSLGAVLYFLLSGRLPEAAALAPVETLRSRIPLSVVRLVAKLLRADPRRRPDIKHAGECLRSALSGCD
jgi:serine/threonine protein kinase